MVCAECGHVIEGGDVIQAQHPIAQWGYTCHRTGKLVEEHVYADDGVSGAEFIKRPA